VVEGVVVDMVWEYNTTSHNHLPCNKHHNHNTHNRILNSWDINKITKALLEVDSGVEEGSEAAWVWAWAEEESEEEAEEEEAEAGVVSEVEEVGVLYHLVNKMRVHHNSNKRP